MYFWGLYLNGRQSWHQQLKPGSRRLRDFPHYNCLLINNLSTINRQFQNTESRIVITAHKTNAVVLTKSTDMSINWRHCNSKTSIETKCISSFRSQAISTRLTGQLCLSAYSVLHHITQFIINPHSAINFSCLHQTAPASIMFNTGLQVSCMTEFKWAEFCSDMFTFRENVANNKMQLWSREQL